MRKAPLNIFVILFCVGLQRSSAAEWECADKFTVDGRTLLQSTVTVTGSSSQSYSFEVISPRQDYALHITTAAGVGIGTNTVSGTRLAVIASTETAYVITAGTGAAYSFVVSTSGGVGIGTTKPLAALHVEGTIISTTVVNIAVDTSALGSALSTFTSGAEDRFSALAADTTTIGSGNIILKSPNGTNFIIGVDADGAFTTQPTTLSQLSSYTFNSYYVEVQDDGAIAIRHN